MPPGMVSALVRIASVGLLLASRAVAQDGLPDARIGIRTTPILLLTRADVRAELRLSPEQTADSERTIADLHEKAVPLKGRNDAEAAEARRTIEVASRSWIERSLSIPQRDRLIQLDLQWEGPSALLRPIVAETLGLGASQRETLARAVVERNSRRNGGPPVEADEAKLAQVVRGLLSESQEIRWQAMIGPAYPFRAASRR